MDFEGVPETGFIESITPMDLVLKLLQKPYRKPL